MSWRNWGKVRFCACLFIRSQNKLEWGSQTCRYIRTSWKKVKFKVKSVSLVQLFVTPWTVAHQTPLSMGFPRQEHWCGLPFPSPEDLPDPGIKPASPALQAVSCIAGRSFNNWATKEPQMTLLVTNYWPHHSKEMATSVLHMEYGNCGFSLCLNMGSDEEFSNSQGSFLFKKFWQQ